MNMTKTLSRHMNTTRTLSRRQWALAATATAAIAALTGLVQAADKDAASAPPVQAALTVTTTSPQTSTLATRLTANGNIAAWQEAIIGTEAQGLRLAEVRVGVGDVVKKGQVLATFAADTVQAELNQTRAAVGEAEATLAEAEANAQRARELSTTGALSAQQINQYLTAERTARARLDAQKAMARLQELRLRQTQVLAPDNGVISSRSATVGAVLPAGAEMFRLIRQGRLEWRAEVPSADLPRLKAGMPANITLPTGAKVTGKLRMIAPTVDDRTRNALIYVDLPASGEARAGMFARGDFEVGSGQALTLPQSAVVLRDGFSYVLKVGADNKVAQTKVAVGRRVGDRVEVTSGIEANAKVVASGGAFLADGDTVRVVAAPSAPSAQPAAKAAPSGAAVAATPVK
jgi:HlyD family secretion protein